MDFKAFLDDIVDRSVELGLYFRVFNEEWCEICLLKTRKHRIHVFKLHWHQQYLTLTGYTQQNLFCKVFHSCHHFLLTRKVLQNSLAISSQINESSICLCRFLLDGEEASLLGGWVYLALFKLLLDDFHGSGCHFLGEEGLVLVSDVGGVFV